MGPGNPLGSCYKPVVSFLNIHKKDRSLKDNRGKTPALIKHLCAGNLMQLI